MESILKPSAHNNWCGNSNRHRDQFRYVGPDKRPRRHHGLLTTTYLLEKSFTRHRSASFTVVAHFGAFSVFYVPASLDLHRHVYVNTRPGSGELNTAKKKLAEGVNFVVVFAVVGKYADFSVVVCGWGFELVAKYHSV